MASITSPLTADLTAVELFAGIGATTLALDDLGVSTVAHAETDPYASAVYAKRFPGSTPLGDVTAVRDVPRCDVMAGGFPCQGASNAGLRLGMDDPRTALWRDFARLIGVARPRIVLIENVSALLNRGLDVVLADLCALGYACEWDCVPAAAVGAPHLRDRVWITAYPEDEGAVRDDRLERALGTLTHPPSKWPRAGRMEQGAVYVRTPLAVRKTKRLNPGSAWVGVRLDDHNGWWHDTRLWPTPEASDGKRGPHREVGGKRDSGAKRAISLVTAVSAAERGLWPTPRASWNENRTRKPAPSHGKTHGRLLAGEANRAEIEAGRPTGILNPSWVEWLMGFPLGWTDLAADETRWHGWNHEPDGIGRVTDVREKRRERLTCLGNGQVPQVMRWWAAPAIERLK